MAAAEAAAERLPVAGASGGRECLVMDWAGVNASYNPFPYERLEKLMPSDFGVQKRSNQLLTLGIG